MIRLMQAADLSQVARIENLVQTHPWSLQQFQESIQSYHSTVIEQAGQVVGFLSSSLFLMKLIYC